MASEPKTLQEATLYFADPANCREYLMARRWPNGVVCPTCGSSKVTFSEKHNRWQCGSHHPKRQFTSKTGTIFEDSPLGLDKWLVAMWQIINCKNGISSYELSKNLGISQKSAWFILHRLREVMTDSEGDKLTGEIEADETFVGGKIQNMHKRSKRKIKAIDDGQWGKTVVLGLLQREGHVRAAVAPTRKQYEVHKNVLSNVEAGSTLYTDEYNAYQSLPADVFTHQMVNHLSTYVKGKVHTNGLENFWSLLKRSLKGTYVSVDPAHLQAYVDEQAFRFNTRKDADGEKLNDGERFDMAIQKIVGKRLTWDALINKDRVPRPQA